MENFTFPFESTFPNYSQLCAELIHFQTYNVAIITQDVDLILIVWFLGIFIIAEIFFPYCGKVFEFFKIKEEHQKQIENSFGGIIRTFALGLFILVLYKRYLA